MSYVKTDTPHVYRRGATLCYQVRDLDGRQRWRSRDPQTGLKFKTEKAAAKARAAEITDRDRGTFTEPSKVTVGDFCAQWLEAMASDGLSPNTVDLRRVHVRAYIAPHLGPVPLQRLDITAVKKWRATLAERGGQKGRPLSRQTVAGAARTLYTALEAAVDAGLIGRNPARARAKQGRRQAEQRQAPKHWTVAELRRFLAVTARTDAPAGSALFCAQRLHPLWVLAADTGARRGELLALKWADLQGETLSISAGRTTYAGAVREGTTKTGKTRRVRLDPGTATLLAFWRERLVLERAEAVAYGLEYRSGSADGLDAGDYIFVDELGAPLHPTTVSRWFDRAVAEAGVSRISFHGLRHTAATLLLEAGVPEHAVADRLGHESVQTTRLIYQHATRPMADAATAAIGSIVHGERHLRAV